MTAPQQPQQPHPPPGAYQRPPREPYAVRHARHMQERSDAEQARRAARGQRPVAPGQQRTSHAGTCLIFGALLVLAGIFGPRLPVWYQSRGGGVSLDTAKAACSSGLGALAQAGSGFLRSACSRVDLYSGVMEAVLVAGCVLLAAGVLLAVRNRPAAAGPGTGGPVPFPPSPGGSPPGPPSGTYPFPPSPSS